MDLFRKKDELQGKKPTMMEKVGMIFTDVETNGKKEGYNKAAKEYEEIYRVIEAEFLETKSIIEKQIFSYDKKSDKLINKLEDLLMEKNKLETQRQETTSKELEEEYRVTELEYLETKNLIVTQSHITGTTSFKLINKLESLQREVPKLKLEVNTKMEAVSHRFGISIDDLKKGLNTGIFIFPYGAVSSLFLNAIYKQRSKKLQKAEETGYAEAKELYEDKINKLKQELNRLKEEADDSVKEIISLIHKLLDAITDELIKIADLKILLQG